LYPFTFGAISLVNANHIISHGITFFSLLKIYVLLALIPTLISPSIESEDINPLISPSSSHSTLSSVALVRVNTTWSGNPLLPALLNFSIKVPFTESHTSANFIHPACTWLS